MKYVLSLSLVFVSAFSPFFAMAETEIERRARLEAELQNVERQILTQSRLVEDKQLERQSLERDISLIEGEIKQAQLGIQELQKKEIERKEHEKEQILTVTKGEEKAYQQLLESQQKTAAQLRSQLFELLGGGGGIPIEQQFFVVTLEVA